MSTRFHEWCAGPAGAAGALGFVLSAVMSAPVHAQTYPTKPVRIVVGYPAGGPIDILARLLTPGFSQAFGYQFIVDNRPGASGMIA